MNLIMDAERFDDLQPWYVGEMIERVRDDLMEAGLKGDVLKDTCGSIVFSMCTLLDGSATFQVEGKEYSSFLAFSENKTDMFYPGGSSYLHEYVFGVLDEVFEQHE